MSGKMSYRHPVAGDFEDIALGSFIKYIISGTFARRQISIYGPYSSVVGEFHKLGNLEEQGFSLPEVRPYGGTWPSIKPRDWKPIVYQRGPASNLYSGFD